MVDYFELVESINGMVEAVRSYYHNPSLLLDLGTKAVINSFNNCGFLLDGDFREILRDGERIISVIEPDRPSQARYGYTCFVKRDPGSENNEWFHVRTISAGMIEAPRSKPAIR